MTQRNPRLELGILHSKEIIGNFESGLISSDGGLMLLQKIDQQLGLTKSLAAAITDGRDRGGLNIVLRTYLPSAYIRLPAAMKIAMVPTSCAVIRYSKQWPNCCRKLTMNWLPSPRFAGWKTALRLRICGGCTDYLPG